MTPIITPIVQRALYRNVCNIGQLTHAEKLQLERAVRRGVLTKGKGGSYPIIKTVYARPGFDFQRDREEAEAELRRANMLDMARGTARFFPWVPFKSAEVSR